MGTSEERMNEASAAKFLAQARRNEIEADRLALQLTAERRADDEVRMSNRYQHLYPFTAPINEQTVGLCMDVITIWSRTSPGCEIEIVLNSPGGSIIFGLSLFDFVERLKAQGHKVTITVMGLAASMAAVLVQSGSYRVMGAESWMLLHEASFSIDGKIGEIEDLTGWVKKVEERIVDIYVKRTKLTKAKLLRSWKRKDWWLSSQECLELGIVDKVV